MALWNYVRTLPGEVKDSLTAAWLTPVYGLKEHLLTGGVRAGAWLQSAPLRRSVASSLSSRRSVPPSRSLSRRAGIASWLFAAAVAHGACPPTGFTGLGDLPGGIYYSYAYAVSGDGTTVVGGSNSTNSGSNDEPFRWRADTGMVGLGDLPGNAFGGSAWGVSGDGRVVTGRSFSGQANCSVLSEAFRWTEATGMVGLGDVPGGCFYSYAQDISPDGSLICGTGESDVGYNVAALWTEGSGWAPLSGLLPGGPSAADAMNGDASVIVGHYGNGGIIRAFCWTSATGMVDLGDPPGGAFFAAYALDVSGDGTVVVVYITSGSGDEGFVWKQGIGMSGLGDLPGGQFASGATGISVDGTIIVGFGTSAVGQEAVLWDETLTLHRVIDVLAANGVEVPCGWILQYAQDVTINCGVISIVGHGLNPNGDNEGWIASYIPGSPPVDNDPDGDAVTNCDDNCPTVANPLQEDTDFDGIGDHCDPPLAVAPDPEGDKTRTVSFSAPTGAAAALTFGQTAIKVTMIDLQNPVPPNLPQFPPPDFSAYEAATCSAPGEAGGCARWVGKPGTFLEAQDVPTGTSYRAARLQCSPFYHDWGGESLFHVTGAEIVPSSSYEVEVFAAICKGNENTCAAVSAPVTMYTRRSGDVELPFNPPATSTQPDVLDVAQLVNKFKSLPGAPIKAIAQLQPNLPELNADINALDVVAVVDAVKQRAYAFGGPCPCPSTVTCGSMACSTATPCVTAFGTGALCVKTCTGPGPLTGDPCINNTHCTGSGTCGAGFCRDRCGRCSP